MLLKITTVLTFLISIQLISQEKNFFERRSTVGEIDFILNNLGQVGYSSALNQSGFVWPKGSDAQYIYGAGLAIFTKLPNGENRNFYTYNPNTASSDFTIGSHADTSEPTTSKYRVYNSNDYDRLSGIANEEFYNEYRWPIWVGNSVLDLRYGQYVISNAERSRSLSSPRIRSLEDMATITKIDDSYPIDKTPNPKEFEDFRLDVETRTYTLESLPNALFISWVIHNRSTRDLDSISIAPIVDVDITRASQRFKGVDNDIMYLPEDNSFAVFATKIGDTEEGNEFNYMVIDYYNYLDLEFHDELIYGYNNIGFFNLDLNTDYSFFEMESVLETDTIKSISGEINVISPSERFSLDAGKKAGLTIQILMIPADNNYPIFSDEKFEDLELDLSANWYTFYTKVRTNVEHTDSDELDLFPNPASDFINFDNKYVQELVEIISLDGKVVLTSTGKTKINISTLQSGAYILKIGEQSQQFIVE
ncbi:MAG: T9SS type A sorting domain-containing protein [Chlorobiota bacterium]